MLTALYVISSSGLVLFSRSFTPDGAIASSERARLHGALISTLSRLSEQVTGGGALRLLEYEHACVYLALPRESPAGAVLFLDASSDGSVGSSPRDVTLAFASALASRLLSAFLDDYGGELEAAVVGAHALGAFKDFGLRLPSIVREVTRAHLQALALLPGADGVALVSDDGSSVESYSSPDALPGREMDDVSVLSTLRPLIASAAELREWMRRRRASLRRASDMTPHSLELSSSLIATCLPLPRLQ